MHSTLDSPDVGEIILTRQKGLVGDTVSATSLEAPKKAAKNYEKALEEAHKKEPKGDKIVDARKRREGVPQVRRCLEHAR
ncbi:MAG: hypothetical protein R2748_08090 [Bryobacterales bacterium]